MSVQKWTVEHYVVREGSLTELAKKVEEIVETTEPGDRVSQSYDHERDQIVGGGRVLRTCVAHSMHIEVVKPWALS